MRYENKRFPKVRGAGDILQVLLSAYGTVQDFLEVLRAQIAPISKSLSVPGWDQNCKSQADSRIFLDSPTERLEIYSTDLDRATVFVCLAHTCDRGLPNDP